MSLTKRWLERISEQMGLEGEITPAVMEEAQRRNERRAEVCSIGMTLRPETPTREKEKRECN
jgi:hypothetical protein